MKFLELFIGVLLLLFAISYIEAAIEWGANTWALDCHFIGNDIAFVDNTRFEECEPLCTDTPDCTHYSWSSDICFLKKGEVFIQDAIEIPGSRCGYIPTSSSGPACVKMWDVSEAEYDDPTLILNICPVYANSANPEPCVFPFTYYGQSHKHCFNTGEQLVCQTSRGPADCILPTNAIITGISTVYGTGISLGGGTLLTINGKRFADNPFSLEPTSSTSNSVFLINGFESHVCAVQVEDTNSNKIVCLTPPVATGAYTVQVLVNGNLVPFYQQWTSKIMVYAEEYFSSKIASIEPIHSTPGTLIKITGDFITSCYTRETSSCSSSYIPLISRVEYNDQICSLINPNTLTPYGTVTQKSLTCALNQPQIDHYIVSLLVSDGFGRSYNAPSLLHATTNDILYHSQTYAVIEDISPRNGSTTGGTRITITGKYLLHNNLLPAKIDISGSPCAVVAADSVDPLNSMITCELVPTENPVANMFHGGRGVSVIVSESSFTSLENLAAAVPGPNAYTDVLDKIEYTTNDRTSQTVWLKGFLSPRKTSEFNFTLDVNGLGLKDCAAMLSMKLDDNMNVIATNNKTMAPVTVMLEANKQ